MKLFDYWPGYLQKILEFQEIAAALQPEAERAAADARRAPEDFFLLSLSSYGVKRWEAILGLRETPGETLEARRKRVLTRYLERFTYTYRALERYLASIDENYVLKLYPDEYRLFIQAGVFGDSQYREMIAGLRRLLPANLVLETAGVAKKTEGALYCAGTVAANVMETALPEWPGKEREIWKGSDL